MNHRPQVLNFPRVINGFLQYKLAEGLSPATVFNFERDLKLWLVHIGDQEIGKITPANLLEFLNYLRSEYVPRRIAGKEERKLSDKTIYNFYVSLSAFFTWASTEFEMANPMKKVPRPRVAEDAPVEPFRREEIELLIKACDACAEADTHDRRRLTMTRPTGKRDKAILLTLLDTGLWARELCAFDDYSCMLLYADLVEREAAWAHIQAAQQLMGGCGLPMRYYVDNLGVFRFVQNQTSVWREHVLQADDIDPQSRSCLRLLGVDVTYALSPQAKGKIERPYRRLQNRIIRTCALEKLTHLEEVRGVLRDEVDRYNHHQVHSITGEVPSLRFDHARKSGVSLFRPFALPQP